VSWRFGAVGIFSRALMTPLFGFFTLFALSLAFEHRRVTRTLAVISGVLVVCIAGGMLFFVLDAIQMRVQVRPEAVRTFDVATIAALAKYGAAIIVGLGFAIPGWKASRRREGVVRRNSGGLVGRSNAAAQVAAE
jgi:predicted metal-binding membrane protein